MQNICDFFLKKNAQIEYGLLYLIKMCVICKEKKKMWQNSVDFGPKFPPDNKNVPQDYLAVLRVLEPLSEGVNERLAH